MNCALPFSLMCDFLELCSFGQNSVIVIGPCVHLDRFVSNNFG